MPEILHVRAGRPYDIHIGRGLLDCAGEWLRPFCQTGRAAVVTDQNVEALYVPRLLRALAHAGISAEVFAFPAGEASKTPRTLLGIYSFLAQNGFTRADLVIALGGGVPGDVAGFAAATFMRGMDFAQIPTTLLAQVDSSIGGKTAVDLPEGKNLAGAFWPPRVVLCDPELLRTLSPRIYADGMAEALKHALIADAGQLEALCAGGPLNDALLARNLDVKRRVVERDEREQGERMLLNFGHTLGHAVEKLAGYGTYTHGEAVAMGMAAAARAGERHGLTEPGAAAAVSRALLARGLPASCPLPMADAVKAAAADKKRGGGFITLVLLRRVGEAFLHRVSDAEFASFFAASDFAPESAGL